MIPRQLAAGQFIKFSLSPDIFVDGTAATPVQHGLDLTKGLGNGVLRGTEEAALYATALIKLTTGLEVEPTSGLGLVGYLFNLDILDDVQHLILPLTSKNISQGARDEIEEIMKDGLDSVIKYFEDMIIQINEVREFYKSKPVQAQKLLLKHIVYEHHMLGEESVKEIVKVYVDEGFLDKKIVGEELVELDVDFAVLAEERAVDLGGIDFNNIELDHERESLNIQFDLDSSHTILNSNIEGFIPIIIDLKPAQGISSILGLDVI